jgi:DNA adenine methylase
MKLPHPIQYQGSKRNLAAQILNYIPNDIDTLIEPFAGTAALSVAAATQKNIKRFHINDLNQPLLNLLNLIIEKPEHIADFYETLWQQQHNDSVEHYYSVREEFKQTQKAQCAITIKAK